MSSDDRWLFVGNSYGAATEAIHFLSTRNFNEADTIFLSLPSVASEFVKPGHSVQFSTYSILEARLAELNGWVSRGHTLVVIGSSSVPFTFVNQQKAAIRTRLEKMAPLDDVEFVPASGARVQYCGPPAAEEVFSDAIRRIRYENLLKSKSIVPLLRVAAATAGGELQVVAGYRKLGDGLIVYVPPFQGKAEQSKAFFHRLALLAKLLSKAAPQLPEWVDHYQSKSEEVAVSEIAVLEQSAANLASRIAAEREGLEAHKALKVLVAGSGTAFANAVASALRELGLTVVEGPHPRADLLSASGARYIAIEAKGIDGAVRETQFRQIERWVTEVNSAAGMPIEEAKADPDLDRYLTQLAKLNLSAEDLSDDCKGFLIVGTFRSTPLAERSEPDFPEPVLRLLNRSKICAITGAQLFSLVMEARESPSTKSEIVNELIETCGVLERGKDWSKYLKTVAR